MKKLILALLMATLYWNGDKTTPIEQGQWAIIDRGLHTGQLVQINYTWEDGHVDVLHFGFLGLKHYYLTYTDLRKL